MSTTRARPRDLSRPGVFRLNIGVGRATFERLVGSTTEPDYAAFDRILPHPVYAKQLWISILNPSDETFRDVVVPLADGGARQARLRPCATCGARAERGVA